ncbi:helix-turn-helix domain-containing protein [Streptomyces kebangsaanensis]|uniref:helix-turn-helix domain-containing protein n=1 Tax=Streptomyces kebangsaanensis TaxID=864058 RepID=UPI00389A3089
MKAVVAVAEEGGFSAAARRLHVVQSAASRTVRALEPEPGAALFRRTTHRVSPAPCGTRLPAGRPGDRADLPSPRRISASPSPPANCRWPGLRALFLCSQPTNC